MDTIRTLHAIQTVDMHTSGEPTRIVVRGYPILQGSTLLEKRRDARENHDSVRRQLMLEPRGHSGMYGAILVQETELTKSGAADIGVLFCHNEGYSTMCGHATIALGRFLVDTHDEEIFSRRNALLCKDGTTHVKLHAPCGIIHIYVPTGVDGRSRSDRPVQFLGSPSFVSKRNFTARIPVDKQWCDKDEVVVDIAYGGAFYVIVSAQEMGFPEGISSAVGLERLAAAAAAVKELVGVERDLFRHPQEADLEFLYGVMIVDATRGSENGELGLCFFADGQIDRSPTGSCVMARVALAVDQGRLSMGDWWTYESIVGRGKEDTAFRGCAVESTEQGVVVKVEGRAFYTGTSEFICEAQDTLADGFVLQL